MLSLTCGKALKEGSTFLPSATAFYGVSNISENWFCSSRVSVL
jgi:hypothetical protein